jgi:hypothetical protein
VPNKKKIEWFYLLANNNAETEFQILVAATMKINVFWDVTLHAIMFSLFKEDISNANCSA